MTATVERHGSAAGTDRTPVGIICGAGSLPFAVADAARRAGRPVVLFAVHDYADARRVAAYPHHWLKFSQFGRFCQLARREGVRDVVFIGGVVRPQIVPTLMDFHTWRLLPRLIGLARGGDDRLLSGIARIFEENGFRMLGAHEIAPDILIPPGPIGSKTPSERNRADIGHGLKVLRATGPFDIGQAVVVAAGRVLAIEAAEGTDEMLTRLAELRQRGRIKFPPGTAVLVKAPKPGQDLRIDLPAIGPLTVEGAARAGLAGIAVVAGSAIVSEPGRIAALADRDNLFVIGVADAAGPDNGR
jgi:DUF1009 family protein